MIDPVGATAAATATIGQSLELIRRVNTTIDLYKNGNARLEYICKDLCGTIEIIELVENLDALRTKGILKALENMLKHAEELDVHVKRVKEKYGTGSPFRRVLNQFMSGPEELEYTDKMVAELTTLKATLILQIQVAHVDLFVKRGQGQEGDAGFTHVLDSVVLHQVNQAVEQRLGKGKGLKIAEVLQDKKPDENGMIRLTQEEYDCLVFHSSGEDGANSQQGTIRVANNKAGEDALQVNGFVDDAWVGFNHNLTIEHNEAQGRATQINNPINQVTFRNVLEARTRALEIKARASQGQYWPPPPPMPPQQPMKELPQAWPYPPWPYYGQPGAVESANAPGNGPQGGFTGPGQVAMPEKQVSVVVAQVRPGNDGTCDNTGVPLNGCNKGEMVSQM
ncbi:hypothetical protein CDV31_004059 [Fusarium ambrosium]|uniref:NACHT-NTPase and P-loop NTPases N-terminal domain-containing protein n=1 Tax=Fusarium ambrosium TaxID=131363 RepID=A0A428USB6_9HYPO|nr:hypothetical protein CDV31_004059 [Fusarium ambrosium]